MAKLKFYTKHKEKINYLLVGGWNTVFGYFLFVALYYWLAARVNYLLLLAVSSLISITNAYLSYKFFVFRTKGGYWREYVRFNLVYGAIAVLNLFLLPLLVGLSRWSPPLAQGALVSLNVVLSFLGNKYYSFGRLWRR
ncbi:MAG: GtrA family protein [Candidatus Saganbacteria bacterium]|nr:GtrA family protein [Candidatus Saganbacteria bacterium]